MEGIVMFCPNCGNELKPYAKFCDKCGTSIYPEISLEEKPEELQKKGMKKWLMLIAVIAIALIIITFLTLYFTYKGKENNPFASITDSDGDGYNDDVDAFINDKNEWTDTDNDGIGNNADICDNGNGGIKVTVTYYKEDEGAYDENEGYDPYFVIYFDYIIDDYWDEWESSSVFVNTPEIYSPFSYLIDVPEDLDTIQFCVEVWDDDFWSSDEEIDYTDSTSTSWHVHTVDTSSIPKYYEYNGSDDGLNEDEDCIIKYQIEIVELI